MAIYKAPLNKTTIPSNTMPWRPRRIFLSTFPPPQINIFGFGLFEVIFNAKFRHYDPGMYPEPQKYLQSSVN